MIPLDSLSSIVALLAALSVASERLVEIIKGYWPWLNAEKPENPPSEGRRKACLQLIAVGAGLLTAWLAKPLLAGGAAGEFPDLSRSWFVLGLLASGGSGFWNSIQSYLSNVKEIKKAEVEEKKTTTEILKKSPGPGTPLPPPPGTQDGKNAI